MQPLREAPFSSSGRLAVPPPTASSAQPLESAGSGPPPQKVMPNPAIASMSVTQGQPGDPVMITGSAFSNDGGEVHFIINPGKDVLARVDFWSDTQLFLTVPDASGILGFNGQAYMVRGSDKVKSNLVPFRFNPGLEPRQITGTGDRALAWPFVEDSSATTIKHVSYSFFWGHKGDDVFFLSTKLKNGWVVDSASVSPSCSKSGVGAYVGELRPGTDSPYLKVHWWINPMGCLYYGFGVVVIGPKGVPDGVAVP